MTELERGQLLTDDQYLEAIEKYGDDFDARMGAEAVHEMLQTIDLSRDVVDVREAINATNSETKMVLEQECLVSLDTLSMLNQEFVFTWHSEKIHS